MNRIKELRKSYGIKQIDLCKRIGVTQGALSGWENGNYEPDIKSLKKLAEIFEVSIDYLLAANSNEYKNKNENSIINEINNLSDDSKEELEKFIELLKTKEMYEKSKNTSSEPTA